MNKQSCNIPINNEVFNFKAVRQSLSGIVSSLFNDGKEMTDQLLVLLLHRLAQLYTTNHLHAD